MYRLNGSSDKRTNEVNLAINKVNVNTIYNKTEDYKPLPNPPLTKENSASKEKSYHKLKTMLEEDQIIDLESLKKMAWSGVPAGILFKL